MWKGPGINQTPNEGVDLVQRVKSRRAGETDARRWRGRVFLLPRVRGEATP